jgi:hypothetical protein
VREKLTFYLQLVEEILDGLVKIRMDLGDWIDNESEKQKQQTQSFKIAECLRPFYLAALAYPDLFRKRLPIRRDVLLKDTERLFNLIDDNGFFPGPYSSLPEYKDQHTDFAAFALEFCSLVYDFWADEPKNGHHLVERSKSLARKSLDFLLDGSKHQNDEKGCRWGGTDQYFRVSNTEELHTDTYFTSVVVIALNSTYEQLVLSLSKAEREDVRNTIGRARKWIADRFDGTFLTGDEGKTRKQLCYMTWGLRALVESYKLQPPAYQKLLPQIANNYLDEIRSRLTKSKSGDYWVKVERLPVLSGPAAIFTDYKERTDVAGILLTLTSLRSLSHLERFLLEKMDYQILFEQVVNSVMKVREHETRLWLNSGTIMTINSYLVEAFLMADQRSKEFDRKIEVPGYLVRDAVRETFEEDAVLSNLQVAVYERLLSLVAEDRRQKAGNKKTEGIRSTSLGTTANIRPKKGQALLRKAGQTSRKQ